MDDKNKLAENLVYQRKLKGLTQKDLSDRTNVTVRTIQRIEKGETDPHLQTIKLLAAALEVEVDELMVLEDPKEENIQKKWLLLIHATPFIGFVIPLANIFIPLFLWIHKRDDNRIYREHGRKGVKLSTFYDQSVCAIILNWNYYRSCIYKLEFLINSDNFNNSIRGSRDADQYFHSCKQPEKLLSPLNSIHQKVKEEQNIR